VLALAVIAAAYLIALPQLFSALVALPDAIKIALSWLLIAPLALFMGMPFPLGMTDTAARAPAFVPWAWGLNGFASVVSAVLATVLAIHIGFTNVILAALALYGLAAAMFPSQGTPRQSRPRAHTPSTADADECSLDHPHRLALNVP
jgi:hypothetical protein